MPFAEVADIEARWRELSDDEQARAATLIGDASAELAAMVKVDESDTEQAELLKIVTCNMVIRAMSATDTDGFGIDQLSMAAGPYSETRHFSNPSGDMYLTKREKKLLGIGGNVYRAVHAHTWADDCDD